MRVIRKLLVPTLIFIGLIIAGLIAFTTISAVQNSNKTEQERLENMSEVFNARIESLEELAIALAWEVAENPEVQVAFANKDRERLIELTLPAYEKIDTQFDIPQHQFHLAPATSFLRLHKLEKFDDDLSSFRFTVLAANAEKKAISGPEIGRGGLGVRGVVPVNYEGEHIGTVEFGTNVDLSLLETLKIDFGYDWQLFLSREPAETATFEGATEETESALDELLLQASTLTTPFFATEKNYQQALIGEASIEQISVQELEYTIYSTPLYDFSGNVIGVVDIISDHTAIAAQQNNQLLLSLAALLLALVVVGFGFSFIANLTLRPIGELSITANAIAQGDFSQRARVTSDDEIGNLAQVFNTMTEQLQGLFGSLEERVADATQSLTLAAEVGQRVSLVQDADLMLAEAVQIIRDRFDMYYTQIYLTDRAEHNLILRAGTGQVGERLLNRGHRLPLDMGSINGTAAIQRKAVIVEDTESSRIHRPNPLLPDTRSEMAIPLIAQDRVVGVLDLQSAKAGALNEENLPAFEALAGQLAIAIVNAELFAEVEEAHAQVEARSAQATREGWDDYLDAIERKDRIAYSYEEENITPLVEPLSKVSDETTLVVPIDVAGAEIGTLQFEGKQVWDKSDAALVSAIAEQVAQQVENIRLLEQSQQYQNEAQKALRRLTREAWEKHQEKGSLAFLYKDAQVYASDRDESFAEKHSYEIKISDEAIGQIDIAGHEELSAEDAKLAKSITEQLSAQLEKLRLSEETERALTETESALAQVQRLGSAVEQSVDGMAIASMDGNIQFVNHAWAEMHGYETKELENKPMTLFHSEEQFEKEVNLFNEIVRATGTNQGEIGHKRKDGTIFPTWMTVSVMMSDEGTPIALVASAQDITERKEAEEAIAKRAVELASVAQISTAVATLQDPDKIIQTVTDLVKENFDLYHAHIYTLDAIGETLILAAGAGEIGAQMVNEGWQIPLDAEQSLVAQAARSREGVIVNDVRAASGFMPNPLLPNTASELAVPLIVGDKVLGVLDVQSAEVNHFTEEDVNIQTTLASQVAVALQNARTYAQTQQQAEHESMINIISQRIQGTTSVEDALQVAVRELGRALGAKQASIQLDVGSKGKS